MFEGPTPTARVWEGFGKMSGVWFDIESLGGCPLLSAALVSYCFLLNSDVVWS